MRSRTGRNTSDCCLSPPSHFFFVRKQKNCADKKIRLRMTWRNTSDLFSVPPEKFIPFSDVQTVVLKKVFLSLRQNAISHATKCDKMRYQCDKMRYRILSHFVACDIAAHWCFIIVLPTLVSIGISCIPRRFDVTNATNCSAGEGAISPPTTPDAGKPRDDHTWRCRQCIALEYVRTQSTLERHTEQQKSEVPKLALYAVRFQ